MRVESIERSRSRDADSPFAWLGFDPVPSGDGERGLSRNGRRLGAAHGDDGPAEDGFLEGDGDDRPADDASDTLGAMDDSLLTEEELAYRDARRRADQKVALTRDLFRAGIIVVPGLIFVFPFGVAAFVYFALKLGRRAFRLFYEPELRERFVREEVQQRVRTRVGAERRHLEGEHHRSLEQLSASIAHEIRNPITAVKSLVQQMGEDPRDVDQEEYARVALEELERVERSISHLLRFAREEDSRMTTVAMEDVLESALETFRDRASRGGIEIERRYDGAGSLDGDSEQLRRVVINLVANAMDALEEGEVADPRIEVSMGENLAGTEVWVRIADNGKGIDDETRQRIFDPFYTSREEGTGLGLALCRKIVDGHGGAIEVETTSGEGTAFVLTFPRGVQTEGER